jgi:hypothetical protein
MEHNVMKPVSTCKVKQCIKYKENGEWVNAIIRQQIENHNKTEIELKGADWKRSDVFLINSGTIVDNCTAPIFQ